MRRQSSRRRVRRDYAADACQFPRSRTTAAPNPPAQPTPTRAPASTPAPPAQQTPTPTPPPAHPPPPSRRRRRRRETTALPPAPQESVFADEEGGATCTSCQVFFGDSAAASSKNNRHHPACHLFDRSIDLPDTSRLRYDVLLSWADTLRICDLQAQLKMYYQKTSGNKVCLTIID